ncbi:uncharacterized protein LAESUDRAFT_753885 [Laetiporus sulphureus 93-53]|uniref:Uncharacterized protein n=1 Tax=Laetiporus sulphureus 93-53 TaxID=1314785 RepID=A0A165IBH2_9APHY|nr:uncharacterized protein LAESUDRAFT_753885 [Laetiporus sulphureus 93-53]KZT12848.1 hypothetical protein LAESUDRAFT_753885 [Laetiporus sulphureus 93-53]
MHRADPLSRRPDHEEGVNLDNADKTLLKLKYFMIKAIQHTHLAVVTDHDLMDKIKEALQDDNVNNSYKDLLKKGQREFSKGLEDWNFERIT